MKTAALVALLICVAGGTRPGDARRCSAYCKGSSSFQYSVGRSYVYDYKVDTVSGVSRTSTEESRLHLSARAEISVISPCDFRLQLHDVTLRDSLPQDGGQRSAVPRQGEFSAALEEHPLYFSFQDGRLDELCPAAGDPDWVLNIKRGVLSAFQSSSAVFRESEAVVYERDVTGVCETKYSTSSSTLPMIVKKTKDLQSCTHRLDYFLSLQSTPYSSPVNVHSLPIVQSEHSCDQIIGEEGFIKRSICKEVHLFRPFSNGENGAMTKVYQYLIHKMTTDDVIPHDSGPLSSTRTTLLYQHTRNMHAQSGDEDTIKLILEEIKNKTTNGVHSEVPSLFSLLVASLNSIQYPQLMRVLTSVRHRPLRKFLLDAMPLVETADALTVMVDLYDSKEITDAELDSWLNTLAYQKRQSLNMLAAVSSLLDVSPRPKTILSVSTLVHSYCQFHLSCQDGAVRDVMLKIEHLLGSHCQPRDTEHMELIIVALKGIGNAGVVVNSLNTLKKCYQMENPIEIRLAAIQAYRRLPCDTVSRSHLLDTYTNMHADTEIRVAAYLQAIQCPSAQTLHLVKDVLYREDVNQVASFVWTHLTNMQETSSRWKQGIKSLISNDFLKNKFRTDVRKFSRNYEASTYLDSLNAGAAVESNVIFTPQSYLPRSAMLNLTLDLFGESFNVLEVGGRAEGLENTVEDIFGSGGYFPDPSVKKFLQNFRKKEDNDLDNSIDKLSVAFDAKGKLQKEPKASLYARVFGNELHYSTFTGLQEIIGKTGNKTYEDYILKLSLGEMTNFMKSFSLIDASYAIPTATGLPLEFSVNGSATVGLSSYGHIKLKDISQHAFTLYGELIPSAVAEITGTMSVNAFAATSGIRSVNKLHSNTYLGGVLKIENGQVAEVKINMPRDKMEVLDVSTNLLLLHRDAQNVMEGIQEDKEEYQGCSPEIISDIAGIKLCGRLRYANASQIPDAPYFPLTGPFALQLSLLKTDTFNAYEFGYKLNRDPLLSSVNINFDTPGSQIDRKFQVLAVYDGKKSGISLNLRTPLINVAANGTIINNSDVKRVDGYLSLDDVAVFQLNAGVQMGDNGNIGYYEPFLALALNEQTLVDIGGKVHYLPGLKYSADLHLMGPLDPISITGDLNLQNDGYLLNGSINSSFIRGSVEGAVRQVSDYISNHAKVWYSVKGTEEQTIELTNKALLSRKGDAELKSIQSSFKMSAHPEYNSDVSWELKRDYDLFSHKLAAAIGSSKWETAQVFRRRMLGQYVDYQLLGMLLCRQKGIDYKVDLKHKTTDISLVSHAIAHLGVKRKYVASLEYLQNPDGDHDLAVELSYSGFNATLNGKLMEVHPHTYEGHLEGNLFVKSCRVRSNMKLSGVYTDESTGVNQDHRFRLSLTGRLNAELSGRLSASENYANQWIQLSVYGQTFRQGITYTYVDSHNLDFTLQIGKQFYNGSAIIKNTVEEKGVSINLFFTKQLTFSVQLLGSDTVEMEVAWNKIRNSNNRIYFTAKSTDYKSEFAFEYPGERISGEVFMLQSMVSAEIQWSPRKKISGVFRWNVGWEDVNLLAKLETPWPGLESQVLSVNYKTNGRRAELQMNVAWQDKSVAFIASGERNRAWDMSAGFEILSQVNTISNMSFNLNHTQGRGIVTDALFIYNDQETSLSLESKTTSSHVTVDLDFISPWLSHRFSGKIIHEIDEKVYSSSIEVNWAPHNTIAGYFMFQKDNPLSLSLHLDTPFNGYEKFVTELSYINNFSELNIKNKLALNDQAILFHVKGMNSEFNGTLSTPFSSSFNIYLNQFRAQNILFISYGEDQFFKLNKTDTDTRSIMQFSMMIHIIQQSVSCHLSSVFSTETSWLQLYSAWNSNTLNMTVSGTSEKSLYTKLIDYCIKVSGSVLPRELVAEFSHFQFYNSLETYLQLPGNITLMHTFMFQNMLNWVNVLKYRTPLKSGSITNTQIYLEKNFRILHKMLAEMNNKTAQIMFKGSMNHNRVEKAVFETSGNPWTLPIKIDFSSTEEDDGTLRSLLNILYNNEQKLSVINSIKLRPLQKSLAFEVASPLNRPVSFTAEYDLMSESKHGLMRLQRENTALETNMDFKFDSLSSTGNMVIKSFDSEFFILKINHDFKKINKTASFEVTLGGQKIQASLKSFPNGRYKVKLQADTRFTDWQKVVVLAQADLLQSNKSITLNITKNSDRIDLSAKANLDTSVSMMNVSIESTLTGIPNAFIYGFYDRRSSNNQSVDLIYVYNKSRTELNGRLRHDMKNFVDDGLLEVVLKSHVKGFEHLAAHISYDNKHENTQRMKFFVLKNNWKLQTDGEATFDTFGSNANLNIDLPFGDMKKITASLSHRIVSNREQTVKIIISCNNQNVEVNSAIVSSGNEMSANIGIITPKGGFENITVGFNLAGIVRQHKSILLTLLTKNHSFKLLGTLNTTSLLKMNGTVRAEFPKDNQIITGALDYDLLGEVSTKRHLDSFLKFSRTRYELNMFVDMLSDYRVESELVVWSPVLNGRVLGSYEVSPHILAANFSVLSGSTKPLVSADIMVNGTLSAQLIFPSLGLQNLSLSGTCDLESRPKSVVLLLVKNNEEFKLAGTLNDSLHSSELQLQVTTPIKNWEMINIHGMYNISNKGAEAKLVAVKGESSFDVSASCQHEYDMRASLDVLQSSLGSISVRVDGYSLSFHAEQSDGRKLIHGHAAMKDWNILLTVQTPFTQFKKLNFIFNYAPRHINMEFEYQGTGSLNSPFKILLHTDTKKSVIKINSLMFHPFYEEAAVNLFYEGLFTNERKPNIILTVSVNRTKIITVTAKLDLDWNNQIGIDIKMITNIEVKRKVNVVAKVTPKFPPNDVQLIIMDSLGTLLDFKSNASKFYNGGFTVHAFMAAGYGDKQRSLVIEYYPRNILMKASVDLVDSNIIKRYVGLVTFDSNDLRVRLTSPITGFEAFVFSWKHGTNFLETDLKTPFVGYEHMSISGKLNITQVDRKVITLLFNRNKNITGFDILFQYGQDYSETLFNIMTPLNGLEKFRFISQYDLQGHNKTAFVRLQSNEIVYKISSEIFFGNLTTDFTLKIFTPIPELKKIKFMVRYSLSRSLTKKMTVYADFNNVRRIDLNFEFEYERNKGKFILSSQSPMIDTVFTLKATYDFSEAATEHTLEGNISLLDIEGSAAMRFSAKRNLYRHALLTAAFKRNNARHTAKMGWDLNIEKINEKSIFINIDTNQRIVDIRAALILDGIRNVGLSLFCLLPSYGLNSFSAEWNALQRNHMECKLESYWDSVKIIQLESSFQLSTSDKSAITSIFFNSAFKNFEEFALVSRIIYSDGYTIESSVLWRNDSSVTLNASFQFKPYTVDAKMRLSISRVEPLLLTMNYNLNSPKQTFEAKFVYGSKKLQIDINYVAPECILIITSPLKGFSYLQFNAKFNLNRLHKSLNLIYMQEDYTTEFGVNMTTEGPKINFNVSLITPMRVLKELVFRGKYIRFSELSGTLDMSWTKGKYIRGNCKFLPHSMRLEMNSSIVDWEHINIESVFLRSKFISKALLNVRYRNEIVDLRSSIIPYDNGTSYLEMNLTTPWTENFKLNGIYEETDDHLVHLTYQYGKYSSDMTARVGYVMSDDQFYINTEAMLRDVGKLIVNAGYNKSSSMNVAFFRVQLGTLRIVSFIEGLQNEQNLSGRFHFESPFENLKKINVNIEISFPDRSGVVVFNKNDLCYEIQTAIYFSHNYLRGWLTLHSPNSNVNNATFDIHFSEKSINISGRALERRINVQVSYELQPYLFSFDSLIEVPFIPSLKQISLSIKVNANNLSGYIQGQWSRNERIIIVTTFNFTDLLISIQTPSKGLYNVQLSGKLKSNLTRHELVGHVIWKKFKAEIHSELESVSSNYKVRSLIKWNDDTSITLQGNLKVPDEHDSEIHSKLNLRMPFDQFNYFGMEFTSKTVNITTNEYNFILSTSERINSSIQSTLLLNKDVNDTIRVVFAAQLMEKEISFTAMLDKDDPQDMKGKLNIVIPFGNIPPITIYGNINLRQNAEHTAIIGLTLPGSEYTLTSSLLLLRHNVLTKLALQTPSMQCNVSVGGTVSNSKVEAVADVNMNNNKVTASYSLDQSSLQGKFHMDIPTFNIRKSKFAINTVYNKTDFHINMKYKYHKHENEILINFKSELSVALYSSINLNFPYFLGKNSLSGDFNMEFGVPVILVQGSYDSGKYKRSASLRIDSDDDKLSIVGDIAGKGSLLLKKNGELVELKLADLLQAELSVGSSSGHIILSLPRQQHKLQYFIHSDNGFECNIEIESSLLRSETTNILISYRNTNTKIAKVRFIAGEQHHGASIELEMGQINAIKLLIYSNNKTILGLQSSLLMNEQNFQGDASLSVYGIQNTILIKHKMTFPLDSEFKLMTPLIPKETIELKLKTEESLLAYAGYGDMKNGQYMLLEAGLLQEGNKLSINLQTPVLSSIKSFTFNGEWDELNFSVASALSSALMSPLEVALAMQLCEPSFDGHFKLYLPIRNYEHYEGNVHIPLMYTRDTYFNVSLSVPQNNYLFFTTFKQTEQDVKLAITTQYREMLANATFHLSCSPKFLFAAEINTPFSDLNHYHLSLNGQTNLREGNDVINYMQWNQKRIELRYSFVIETKKFITEVKLLTPFKNYNRYAMKLQYGNTARKVAVATLSYPGLRKDVGIEFDYLYKGIFDINLIAQFNLPFLPGFGRASLLLGNKLNLSEGSYKAIISGLINDKVSSLAVEGLFNSEEAKIKIQAHQNDKELYLLSSLNSRDKLTLLWELRTPFPMVRNFQTSLHYGPHELQIGAIYNSREIIGLELKALSGTIKFELRNPIRPISFSYFFNNDRYVLFSTEICWDLNNEMSSKFGVELSFKYVSINGFEVKSELKLPTRVLSYDAIFEQYFDKIQFAMHFSWEEGKLVGYHILVKQIPKNSTFYARIDLPFRSFESSARNEISKDTEVLQRRIEFLWDAADDRSKKLGVYNNVYKNESMNIILDYALINPIVIQCSPNLRKDESKVLFGRDVKIVYSTIPEEVFTGGVYLVYDETSLDAGFSVLHVPSRLDIHAKLSIYANTALIGGKLNVTYMEPHTRKSNGLVSVVKLGYVIPELDIFFETSRNYIGIRGLMWQKRNGYHGVSLTGRINQEEPLTLSAAINTRETALEVGMNTGASRCYSFTAQFPNWQEITTEASHSLNGIKTVDGFLTLRLNTSRILWTRVQWRPPMFEDLKPIIIQEYGDFVYVVNAIFQSYVQLFTENFEVNFPIISLQEVSDYMKLEMNAIQQDFIAIGVDLSEVYARNDFFLQDICGFLKSTCSDIYAGLGSVGRAMLDSANLMFSSIKMFTSFCWDAMSMDYILSTFSTIEKMIQKVIHKAIQEIKIVTEALKQWRAQLKNSTLVLLERTRLQIIILSEYVAQISQGIEVVVQNVKRVLERLIEVTIERAEIHFRREVMHIVLKMSAIWSNVTDTIMRIPEVREMQKTYLMYVSWLEEFHVQEYIDNLMDIIAQTVDSLLNDVLLALNDVKLLVSGAAQPYLDEAEHAPVLLNIRTIINQLYHKLSWIWKYYEITDRVLNGVEVVLEQSDDMLLDLMVGMNTNFEEDSKTDLVFRPELGLVEYVQELPVDWNGFNELPKFDQFKWYPLEGGSQEQISKLDRYSYFFLDPMNSVVNKSMSLLFPPFTKHAVTAGKSFFITFDDKFYEFEGQCSYLLASDFIDKKFSAIVSYDIENQKIVKKSLTVISEGQHINIGSNNQVSINNKKFELPMRIGKSTWITRSGETILIHTKFGMAIECNLHYDVCTVELNGWYFAKTGGLLGTFDNEQSNDISLPDGTITPNIEFFANSWRVGKNSRCRTKLRNAEEPQKPKPESSVCASYFQHASSPLSSCFPQIDPQPYYEMCLRSGNETCLSTAAYVIQCRKVGVEIWMPAECVKCSLPDGSELTAGEQMLFTEQNTPQTADVVLVVEQVDCLKSVRAVDVVSKLEGALRERGIDARYSVVGFGGNNFYRPHTRTANGEVWTNRKLVDKALNGLEFDSKDSNKDVTVYDALWFASRLSFRGAASKTIVLMQCKACDEQEDDSDYSDMLTVLQDNDIALHILQPDAVKVGSSQEKTAKLFGMDMQGTYSGRNAKTLTPSKNLLRQVAIPKNLCTSLALETNGTLFNSNHIAGNRTLSTSKKFLDVWSQRVALTAIPSMCQKCECAADGDSVGQMMCTKCLSPSIESILEDIEKMWSEEEIDGEDFNE